MRDRGTGGSEAEKGLLWGQRISEVVRRAEGAWVC